MAVSFLRDDGTVALTLPIGMRMASDELLYSGDGQVIPGRDGRLWRPSDARREPITLSVTGQVVADTPEALDDTLRSWATALDRQQLLLSPRDSADKVIRVRQTRVTRQLTEGAGGILADVQLDCTADDPFWVARAETSVEFDPATSGATITINNPGTLAAQPQITIYGATVGSADLVNPRLTNQTNGDVLQLALSLASTDGVVVYPIYDRVGIYRGDVEGAVVQTFPGVNVTGAANEDWFSAGFSLEPGDNVIEFSDDASSCHQARIVFTWRSAWY